MHIKHGPAICPVTPVCASRHTDLPLWKNRHDAERFQGNAIPLAIYTAVILPSQSKKERQPLSGSRRQRLLDKRDPRDGEEEDKDDEAPQR